MKEVIKELVQLIIMIILCSVAFFALVGIVCLMLNGIEILPQYIGGLFTFLLYISGFVLFFALVIKTKNETNN